MSTFGERLRREREMRNISLDDIAATTKVGTRLLRALEDEQFDQLPGGIFNKGYVREYAKYVGIDEEQAVADYLEAVHEAPSDVRGSAEQTSSGRFDRTVGEQSSELRGPTFPLVPVLIVLALVAGIIGGWHIYRERQLDRQSQPARTNAATPNNAPVSTPAGIPDKAAAPAAQAVSGKSVNVPLHRAAEQNAAGKTANGTASSESGVPFELTVRPKDRAWVSIKSDGQFVVRGIIKPPDVKTIRARSEVIFFTGNAGAVEVSFNGKNVPLTGGANDEQVLVFNSHGVLPSAAPQ